MGVGASARKLVSCCTSDSAEPSKKTAPPQVSSAAGHGSLSEESKLAAARAVEIKKQLGTPPTRGARSYSNSSEHGFTDSHPAPSAVAPAVVHFSSTLQPQQPGANEGTDRLEGASQPPAGIVATEPVDAGAAGSELDPIEPTVAIPGHDESTDEANEEETVVLATAEPHEDTGRLQRQLTNGDLALNEPARTDTHSSGGEDSLSAVTIATAAGAAAAERFDEINTSDAPPGALGSLSPPEHKPLDVSDSSEVPELEPAVIGGTIARTDPLEQQHGSAESTYPTEEEGPAKPTTTNSNGNGGGLFAAVSSVFGFGGGNAQAESPASPPVVAAPGSFSAQEAASPAAAVLASATPASDDVSAGETDEETLVGAPVTSGMQEPVPASAPVLASATPASEHVLAAENEGNAVETPEIGEQIAKMDDPLLMAAAAPVPETPAQVGGAEAQSQGKKEVNWGSSPNQEVEVAQDSGNEQQSLESSEREKTLRVFFRMMCGDGMEVIKHARHSETHTNVRTIKYTADDGGKIYWKSHKKLHKHKPESDVPIQAITSSSFDGKTVWVEACDRGKVGFEAHTAENAKTLSDSINYLREARQA